MSVAAIRPIRVLLVEDNHGDARLILEMLREVRQDAFELERVERLEQALERVGRAAVDVVLLDLGLADSQGLETFRRAHEGIVEEPIIVISGLDDESTALEAVRAGAQDYLVKGRLDGAALARVIRYALERQRTELRLRWLSLAVDQSPASIFITDPHGTIRYVNERFTQITGYAPAEAIGKTPRIFKSGLTPPEYYRALWTTITGGNVWHAEIQNRRKSGEVYWDAVTVSPIRDQRGAIAYFLAVQEDITRRKDTESALRESDRRARTLFETVNLVVLGLDRGGMVEYVNPFFLQRFGYARDAVIGRNWFELVPASQRATMQDVFRDLIDENEHTHYENPVLTKDGQERLIAWNNTVLRDVEGQPIGTLSIGEDITERTQLELQLRQAQKMEAIGRLAGGVAHDFNNVLTAVFGYVDLLREEMPPGSSALQDLAEVRKAAERAADLTRQLLAFSRQQVLEPVVLPLNDHIEEFEKMLRRVIGEDVELRLALSKDIGNVRADPGQLQQVIMNLAVNARDAMPQGGKLLLETANVDLSEQYAELHQPVIPGRYVMLAVSDTGTGMPPDVKARIFEPFFTTKEKGKGTGLGLSTVYGIVKQSGGYVWVYTELGRGTTFKVYLPRVDAPPDRPAKPREAGTLTGSETILLAEDDAILRPLAKALLVKLGYTVLEAENADAALAAAQAHQGPIHLLVSDVVMPGPSGRELARRLAALRPETRVLFVSGYTDDAIVHHGMLEPGLNFLQKPFTPSVLARKVREVLDAK
ncbi:MAG TPA: PAS domain S-box protein [Gemmatimonadales bacterium]|nr:PAS domain S-box protein [Gemmatimonadales bacterium]